MARKPKITELTIDIEGVAEVLKNVGTEDKEIKKDFKKLVADTAKNVRATARSKVRVAKNPWRTVHTAKGRFNVKRGDLKRQIKVKAIKKSDLKDGEAKAGWQAGMMKTVHPRSRPHAHLIEDGSAPRQATKWRKKPMRKPGNRGSMPAKQYMTPAHDAHAGRFDDIMKKIIEKVREV